jgi:tetratricopeptide (TPR) repeat protein
VSADSPARDTVGSTWQEHNEHTAVGHLFKINYCMKGVKSILKAVLLTVSIGGYGQQIDYSSWKEESKGNIRLLPEYGNATKTKEQKEADDDFIRLSLQQDRTREKASEHMVELGFNYLYRKDLRTAMYRFNQAWLLNPKNENAYWGFGAIYFMFNDFENAMTQYTTGLKINPKSSNILTDKATVYLTKFNTIGGKINLDSATNIFKRSYFIDPKNQNTLFKLSACYFLNDNCKDALKYYEECEALGGRAITKEYTEALNKKCRK